MPCPYCLSSENVTRHGYSNNCRRVIMEDRPGVILGYRYKCGTCNVTANCRPPNGGKRKRAGNANDANEEEQTEEEKCFGSFHGYDPRVLDLLPLSIRATFPLLITSRSAIQKTIVNKLVDDMVHGKGVKPCREFLKQSHFERFTENVLIYLDEYKDAQRRLTSGNSLIFSATVRSYLGQPPEFGCFDDSQKYGGYVPSEHYLESLFEIWMSKRTVLKVEASD